MKRNLAVWSIWCSALLTIQCIPATAQQDKWLQLGAGKANQVSTNTYLPSDIAKGPICAVRLQVDGAGIEIDGLIVHFGNGQVTHFPANELVASDTSSKSTPLPGPPRTVRGVEVIYRLQDPTAPPPSLFLWGDSIPGVITCHK
jgi:hypothetical protein